MTAQKDRILTREDLEKLPMVMAGVEDVVLKAQVAKTDEEWWDWLKVLKELWYKPYHGWSTDAIGQIGDALAQHEAEEEQK